MKIVVEGEDCIIKLFDFKTGAALHAEAQYNF